MKTSCKTKHNTPFPVLNYSKSNKYFPQFSEHPNSTIVFSSRRIQELRCLEHLYKILLVYTVRNISMLFLNHNNQLKNLFLSIFLLSSYAMLVSSWRYLTICCVCTSWSSCFSEIQSERTPRGCFSAHIQISMLIPTKISRLNTSRSLEIAKFCWASHTCSKQ